MIETHISCPTTIATCGCQLGFSNGFCILCLDLLMTEHKEDLEVSTLQLHVLRWTLSYSEKESPLIIIIVHIFLCFMTVEKTCQRHCLFLLGKSRGVLYFFTHSLKWKDTVSRNECYVVIVIDRNQYNCYFNSTYYKLELAKFESRYWG